MVLTAEDLLIVLGEENYSGENSMLYSDHIDEFNMILQLCTNFNMQTPLLVQTPSQIRAVSLNDNYLQILFSGSVTFGHWICIYYSAYVIHVYDSMNQCSLHDDHKLFIDKLFPDSTNIQIVYERVQSQINIYDCGIFSIAFATAIIKNKCPCTLNFSISEMRKHLLNLYQTRTIEMFPLKKNVNSNNNNSLSSPPQYHQIMKAENLNLIMNNNINFAHKIIKSNVTSTEIKDNNEIIYY